ncbi:MAG: hmc operon protein 4 [Myxococcota bacterium]|nr:hmc operon protein 4 [Myxococcota bacterium]
MDFYTLQDFLTFTKGMGYGMMFIALMTFIPFWLFLTDREKRG